MVKVKSRCADTGRATAQWNTDAMALAVVTWYCFPACHERRTQTQLDAAAPTCWLTLMTSSWLFWSHQTRHQSSGSEKERGWEAMRDRETQRKVREDEEKSDGGGGGGGIRWPLGHSLQVHRDRADSRVSRSHTCVSEIYCWVGGLMTPSWCLRINLTGTENCFFLEYEQHQRQENEGEGGRVLLSVLVCGVYSVAVYTHWTCMSLVCICVWVSPYSTLCNKDRRVRIACVCVLWRS